MTARLATEEVRPREGREADRWAWFLHGIYGRGRNWRSVARRLVEAVPGRAVRLVDLRLHGASTRATPPHTLEACGDDLEALAAGEGVARPDVVLGHSFGGKVALELARRRPEGLEQAWVVDSTPSAGEPGGVAWRMLDAVRREPGPFDDRDAAVEALGRHGFPPEVGRWMATNLERGEGGYRWGLDLEGMEALLRDFFRRDYWAVVEDPPPATELEFVKAEASDVVGEEELRRLRAAARDGGVRVHRIPGAHWLNVSNPDGLLELMEGRMPR